MAVTLKQISEMAGVSVGTVDRALNNRGRINADVKRRIIDIANALGYVPNVVAKSLATRKKNFKIGFIIHVQQNDFHDVVLKGVQQAADEIRDFGVEIIVRETEDFKADAQLKLIDELLAENISALAILPINDPAINMRLKQLYVDGLPIVFVGGYAEHADCLCHVGHDSILQGRLVANLFDLITSGPARLLAFVPSLKILGHVKLVEGLSACLKSEYSRLSIAEIVELGNDEITNYNIVKNALNRHLGIDAVFFGSAVIAGCLRALEEVCAKGSVKVISTFNSPTVRKALLDDQICAAVWNDPQEIGYRAIMVLFEYITSDQLPADKKIYVEHRILLKQNLK